MTATVSFSAKPEGRVNKLSQNIAFLLEKGVNRHEVFLMIIILAVTLVANFSYVGSFHEGFPYALELSKKGYNAFVLQYRVGGGGAPATRDLAAALSFIFANADTLEVSTSGYSLWGSSRVIRFNS